MNNKIIKDIIKLDGLTLTSLKLLFLFSIMCDDNGMIERFYQKEISTDLGVTPSVVNAGIKKLLELELIRKDGYNYYINLDKINLKKETE